MECDICQRPSDTSLDFYCIACARNAVYVPRLEQARILLERNALKTKVEELVESKSTEQNQNATSQSAQLSTDQEIWRKEWKQVQTNEGNRRVTRIREDQENVRLEFAGLRTQIEELKVKIAEKKHILNTIRSKVPQRWSEDLSKATAANPKASLSLLQVEHKTISSRATLCREAASLMRLRQRRRQRDVPGREQYSIAGLTLPDLREISNVRCADLTAVLGSVAHLLQIVAFYLGVRLPAEIKLQSKEYPSPTVNTPITSYKGTKSNYPFSAATTSSSSSSSASKLETSSSLKPRPLSISSDSRDERIVNFQKMEPQAFNIFVEGIALLAWNVAWLCRSQGFTVGTNSWEEICNIGKNLHQLLIAHPQAPSISRIQSDRTVLKRPTQSRKSTSAMHDLPNTTVGKLGQNSDLSAANYAAKVSQNEIFRSWTFLSWQAVALSLRKTLLTEITSAEWELLQDEEWDDGGEQFNEAVFVKTRTLDGQQYDDARSIMTTKTHVEDEPLSSARTPGTSGWTKLKSREQP